MVFNRGFFGWYLFYYGLLGIIGWLVMPSVLLLMMEIMPWADRFVIINATGIVYGLLALLHEILVRFIINQRYSIKPLRPTTEWLRDRWSRVALIGFIVGAVMMGTLFFLGAFVPGVSEGARVLIAVPLSVTVGMIGFSLMIKPILVDEAMEMVERQAEARRSQRRARKRQPRRRKK